MIADEQRASNSFKKFRCQDNKMLIANWTELKIDKASRIAINKSYINQLNKDNYSLEAAQPNSSPLTCLEFSAIDNQSKMTLLRCPPAEINCTNHRKANSITKLKPTISSQCSSYRSASCAGAAKTISEAEPLPSGCCRVSRATKRKAGSQVVRRPALSVALLSIAIVSCLLTAQSQAFLFNSGPSTSDSESSSPLGSALAAALSSGSSSVSAPSSSSGSAPSSTLTSSQQPSQSPAGAALSAISSAIVSAALDGKPQSSAESSPSDELANPDNHSEGSDNQDLSPAASMASSILSSVVAAPSSSGQPSGSSSPSAQPSLASSIGSAVAQAAASAAVAAARNTLSNGDARSLTNSQGNTKTRRNQGLNLALKIVADTIPEVPYNILHNMKKLDHAAPFYNVGNKVRNTGLVKESSAGLLASVLHASGGYGGAAEHFSSLLKSPIWKRIADGYGDFASEFRSLFKVPTNMKGPSSSTSKLLRDISVPAMLMLLASTIPSDWRPMRTRRKSLLPSDLATSGLLPSLDPLSTSASEQFPASALAGSGFNLALQQYPSLQQASMSPRASPVNPLAQMYSQLEQSNLGSGIQARSAAESQLPQKQTSLLEQPADNWATSAVANTPSQSISGSLFGDNLQGSGQQQQAQSVRRFGDSSAMNLRHQQSTQQPSGGLLSSLTSNLASQIGQSKLMTRIMNSNSVSSGNVQDASRDNNNLSGRESHSPGAMSRIANLVDELNRPVVARQDHLGDKHRYTLIDENEQLVQAETQERASGLSNGDHPHHRLSSSQSTKPFVLSAMSHAIGSMFKSGHGSGSPSSAHHQQQQVGGLISNKFYTLASDNSLASKLSHQQDSLVRRNQVTGVQEQRDLTQLLPPSWRQAVKRTVGNVQHQASTQWRTIEGQLTNWVQDKLKTPSTVTGYTGVQSPSSGQSGASAAAPVANIIASVSSTAMNLLGLGGRTGDSQSLSQPPANSSPADQTATSSTANPESLKNKNDQSSSKPNPIVTTAKGALVGITNLIVNSLSNRHSISQTPTSATASTSASVASGSSPAPSLDSRSSHSSTPDDAARSIVGQYPTQTLDKSTSSSSMASGTASTVAGLSLMARR